MYGRGFVLGLELLEEVGWTGLRQLAVGYEADPGPPQAKDDWISKYDHDAAERISQILG